MDTTHLQTVKSQLAAVLGDLEERRTNPFKGTVLEALAEEIRTMRRTYRLSYREITAKLVALKVDTDEEKVAAFCRFLFKSTGKATGRRRQKAKGELPWPSTRRSSG